MIWTVPAYSLRSNRIEVGLPECIPDETESTLVRDCLVYSDNLLPFLGEFVLDRRLSLETEGTNIC
jgi:hypothetical protein